MKKISIRKMDDIAGIGTWAAVFIISLFWLFNASSRYSENILPIIFLFIAYVCCLVSITRDPPIIKSQIAKLSIYTLQLVTTFLILWYLPLTFLAILTIIWVSMLPHYFSIGRSVIITVMVVTLWFSLFAYHWQTNTLFEGVLFGTFHFFAILMTYNAQKAEQATAKAERLNKELLATQQLLSEVSRQNERSRIARDLHDLLGHHLTALIINLQVATHMTEGDAKSKVEQCHAIAKLLLSDVRDAVTVLKENQALDFHKLVDVMIENIPTLTIINHIDTQLNLENLNIAKSLLSCIQEAITNTLRHSGASELEILMIKEDNNIKLEILDNGQLKGIIEKGNGLKGMTERVEQLDGQLSLDKINNALHIRIVVPLLNETKNYDGALACQ